MQFGLTIDVELASLIHPRLLHPSLLLLSCDLPSPLRVRACNVQVWNEEDGEDEVLAMVARTGLRTTVGNLLRQVMSPVHATQPRKDTFVVVSYHHKLKLMAQLRGRGGGGQQVMSPLLLSVVSFCHNVSFCKNRMTVEVSSPLRGRPGVGQRGQKQQ